MTKDFDKWNIEKQKVENKIIMDKSYFHEREIVWISCGINIGIETNGKNDEYTRPALIIKKLNKSHYIVLFCTTSEKENYFYHKINSPLEELKNTKIIISQIKTIDRKRIIKKIVRLNSKDYEEIISKLKDLLFTNNLSALASGQGTKSISINSIANPNNKVK